MNVTEITKRYNENLPLLKKLALVDVPNLYGLFNSLIADFCKQKCKDILENNGWKIMESEPLKIVIKSPKLATGESIANMLRRKQIECEYADKEYVVFPGFCDVHVHFREPGFSYKETVATATLAAARGGYLRLRLSHGGAQGVELAVAVCLGDRVAVDEGQCPHTGAAQRLRCPAAYAAETEHRHVAAGKCFHGLTAQHRLRAGKSRIYHLR